MCMNDNMWFEQLYVFIFEYVYEEVQVKFGKDLREYLIQMIKMVVDKQGCLKEIYIV